jgi:acyl-CoA synthetase (AMP-forming)/AMP-acid ligase II
LPVGVVTLKFEIIHLHCSYNCRGTHITGTPTLYIDLINNATMLGVTLTTLKVGAVGGNTCTQQVVKNMMDKLNIRRVSVSLTQYICMVW